MNKDFISKNKKQILDNFKDFYYSIIWKTEKEEKTKYKVFRWNINWLDPIFWPFVLALFLYMIYENISDLHIEAKNTESFSIKIRKNKELVLLNY